VSFTSNFVYIRFFFSLTDCINYYLTISKSSFLNIRRKQSYDTAQAVSPLGVPSMIATSPNPSPYPSILTVSPYLSFKTAISYEDIRKSSFVEYWVRVLINLLANLLELAKLFIKLGLFEVCFYCFRLLATFSKRLYTGYPTYAYYATGT